MNIPAQSNFVDRVREAEGRVTETAFDVSRLANRLCGPHPEGVGEAIPPRSDAVFDQTRETAEAIIRAANDIARNIARIEAALPSTELPDGQYDARFDGGKAMTGTMGATNHKGF